MSISESRILQLALARLESQRRDLDIQITELKNRQPNSGAKRRGRPRKEASAETQTTSATPVVKPKRRMSAAQRAAISEKLKERWVERKKQARKIDKGISMDPDRTKPRLIKA